MSDDSKNSTLFAQKVSLAMYERDIAAKELGITLGRVEPGYAELKMMVKKWMLQGHNICHGGFIFSLADTAMAYASNSRNQVNLAMNANIDFLRPANLGDNLKAIAVEGNKTKNTGMYDVKVYGKDDTLVCHFRGRTFNITKNVI